MVYDGDALIGCAFFYVLEDAMYVGKVAVAQTHRQQGIARQIFLMIENQAIEQSVGFLELETRVELTENHHTFAALGFCKTGEKAHRGFHQSTSIIMRKKLG